MSLSARRAAADKENAGVGHWSRRSVAEVKALAKQQQHAVKKARKIRYDFHGRRIYKQSKGVWERGDESFETEEMKAARAALRHDAAVASALQEWWACTDLDGNGAIDRDEYIELGKALYRVMIADGNEVEAYKSAVSDWEDDSKGASEMDGKAFKTAIFELADLWTNTLDAAEYVTFLRDLLVKMRAAGLGMGIGYKA